MNNLYVFAIGGSGERIMHSFIMMLAAGMPIGAHTVIPVFIDNDVESEALTRCINLINYYRTPRDNNSPWGMHALYDGLGDDHRPSFAQANIGEPITLKTDGGALGSLNSIIGDLKDNDPLQRAIAEERDLLFTTDDLQMRLDVGFVGNPNIGSIVLNYMTSTKGGGGINGINPNAQDGVMVGSLFGGTGAAGFPLIINSFYKNNPNVCPLLGGVAVLPYFNLPDVTKQDIIDTTKWNVHADTFDARTRAALMYYDDYMQNMDYCYYIGDDQRSQYDHHIGGKAQNNPANLIEVMAALSIFDFAKQSGHPTDINYKRPRWGFTNGNHSLSNVSGILNKDLKRALVKFQMMKSLFDEPCFLENDLGKKKMPYVKDLGITKNHLIYIADDNKIKNLPQAWGLQKIFREWDKWIAALGSNEAKRKFQLFDNGQTVDADNLTKLFYTDDSELGIAKMGIKKEGKTIGIFGGTEVKYPLPPKIANELTNAYDKLYPKGTNPLNIKDDERLGKLLQVLSLGLDNVIDKNCTL